MMTRGKFGTPDRHFAAILERFERGLDGFSARRSGRIFVGFSGGLDSTVLLYLCSKLKRETSVVAVHVNHGLHEKADEWELHCSATADRFGVEFVAKMVGPIFGNVEYQARRLRYRCFREIIQEGDVVLTAHHANDDIESLLWQLFTGRALVGVRESRPLGQGILWRPLLNYSRAELKDTARENSLDWIEDHTNADISFDRNYIRHRVVPHIFERFSWCSRQYRQFED